MDEILGDKAKYIEAFDELVQNAHTMIDLKVNESQNFLDQIDSIKEAVHTTTGTLAISTALVLALLKDKLSK